MPALTACPIMLVMDGNIHRFQPLDVPIRREHPTKMRIAILFLSVRIDPQ